jgi:hypothetical protein
MKSTTKNTKWIIRKAGKQEGGESVPVFLPSSFPITPAFVPFVPFVVKILFLLFVVKIKTQK